MDKCLLNTLNDASYVYEDLYGLPRLQLMHVRPQPLPWMPSPLLLPRPLPRPHPCSSKLLLRREYLAPGQGACRNTSGSGWMAAFCSVLLQQHAVGERLAHNCCGGGSGGRASFYPLPPHPPQQHLATAAGAAVASACGRLGLGSDCVGLPCHGCCAQGGPAGAGAGPGQVGRVGAGASPAAWTAIMVSAAHSTAQ